jgi:hypothetical protein
MIHVKVTADDIVTGVAGDCDRCPVALALVSATGDNEVLIYERDWELWIEVWGVISWLLITFVNSSVRSIDNPPPMKGT